MEFASKSLPSQTNSTMIVWLVGFGCVEMGLIGYLSQAGTHCVAQVVCGFAFFYLVYVQRRLLIAPLTWSIKKKNLQGKCHGLFGSFPRVVLQMLKHKTSLTRNLMFR